MSRFFQLPQDDPNNPVLLELELRAAEDARRALSEAADKAEQGRIGIPAVDLSAINEELAEAEALEASNRAFPEDEFGRIIAPAGSTRLDGTPLDEAIPLPAIDPDSEQVRSSLGGSDGTFTFGERFFNDRSLGGNRNEIGKNIPVISGELNYPDINSETIFADFSNPRNGICNFVEFKVFSKRANDLNYEFKGLTDFKLGIQERGGAGIQTGLRPGDGFFLEGTQDDNQDRPSQDEYTNEQTSEYFYEGLGDIRQRIKDGDQAAKREFVDLVSKDIRAGKATEQVGETIRMYFPNDLNLSDTVEYQDVNLNFFQSIVEGFGGGAGAANFGTLVGTRTISNLIGGASDLLSAAIPGIKGDEIGSNISGAISAKVGFVENPKNESLFKGVNRKTFNMQFTFAPRSEKESQIAVNIIEAFRFQMLPELSLSTTFLLTPNEFEISLLKLDLESGQFVRNPALPNPGRCFLLSAEVNYAPNPKSAFFRNGVACQMNLSLSFAQAFIMNKQLVLGGF